MLKDEGLFSNSEDNMVGSKCDQETTNNGMNIYNSCNALIHLHIAVTDVTIDSSTEDCVTSGIPVVHTITNPSFLESCTNDVLDNAIMINCNHMESNNEISVVKEKSIKAVNITEDNISEQICISPDENVENDVASLPKCSKKMKHNISSTNMGAYSVLCCKVSMAFGACFIIGCFLLPLIFYYVNQTGGNSKLDPYHSYRQNISSIKVCYKP